MKTLMVAAGLAAGLFCSTLAIAETKPTIAVIVNETNSPYWQAVLAGARAAGTELGANISELGDPSGSDAKSQSLLDKAVDSRRRGLSTTVASRRRFLRFLRAGEVDKAIAELSDHLVTLHSAPIPARI